MRSLSALAFASVSLITGLAGAMAPKDVYKTAGPAVTLVLGSDDGRQGSSGTGSVITSEGKMITNAHVVLNAQGKPYKTLYIYLKPPKITGDNAKDLVNRYKGRVLAYSPPEELDLALIQIDDAPKPLSTITFANPNNVEVGDEVVAIGHPEQGGLWTLTSGTVSTLIANFNGVKGKDVFQTEASVNRGNSGGPLLDDQAHMVGINTMIARQAADGLTITSVNFALKSSVAVNWLAGQGMGLAYAPKTDAQLQVASAPQANRPSTEGYVKPADTATAGSDATTSAVAMNDTKPTAAKPTAPTPQPVTPPTIAADQKPPSTIVVADTPPAKPEELRQSGQDIGKSKGDEKVTQGQRLDPAKAKPNYLTQKRPFNLDELRKQQMKEMDDMMNEMRNDMKNYRR
ncbi:MAG: trypsin-like peptidase domain-containing protein [Clostridia bacterium]|nr:trypsin-like peptidase domain-containing protein [Deltaproteobacteria bacterium]